MSVFKWHSQDTADARAQDGRTTFVGISEQNEDANLGALGDAPPRKFEIFELFRSVLRLFQAILLP